MTYFMEGKALRAKGIKNGRKKGKGIKRRPKPHEWWDIGIHPITGFENRSVVSNRLYYGEWGKFLEDEDNPA